MKIISGEKKGKNFYMPAGIRPTQNLTRKAIFDIIGHDLEGVEMIDLFAGSGAVGLEALSQGARKVTFVEINPKCFSVIEENIRLLGFNPLAENFPTFRPGMGFPPSGGNQGATGFSPRVGTYSGGPTDRVELINGDAFVVLKTLIRQGRKFDLVFLDPPYTEDLLKKILKSLCVHDIFKPNSLLIVEHRKDENLPELEGRFLLVTHRKYGISSLAVYQVSSGK